MGRYFKPNKGRSTRYVAHMAGIVPIVTSKKDYSVPFDPCLMPVAQDYLIAEKAVYECALAGCETIWVVVPYDFAPIIRKKVGDYIEDPVSRTIGLNPGYKKRLISVYYVSIPPKYRNRRYSTTYGILYGADIAFRSAYAVSSWIMPDKYYCAMPYNIIPDDIIWDNRDKFGTSKKAQFRYNNQTIKDGLNVSFTFMEKDYMVAKKKFLEKLRNDWHGNKKENDEFYKISEIFSELRMDDEYAIDLDWHYDISSWEKYREFLASPHQKLVVKNKPCFSRAPRIRFIPDDMEQSVTEYNKEVTVHDPLNPMIGMKAPPGGTPYEHDK